MGDSATSGLVTIDDEITIIVPTDLTDEDAVRVDYVDTDGEGIPTQIGTQVDAPAHSGIVSFDGSNYKVADTVTVTLTDADLIQIPIRLKYIPQPQVPTMTTISMTE